MTTETHTIILNTARKLFTENGYLGTTTRAIAQTAGVNEVTIFRHFGSKEALFLEAIQANSPAHDLKQALESQMTGNLERDLKLLGQQFFGMMLKRRKAILMTLWEAEQHPEIRPLVGVIPAIQRNILAEYFQNQSKRGNLLPINPHIAAQAFLGMFMAYAINLTLSSTDLEEQPVQQIVEQFVQIFLKGIQQNKDDDK